MDQSPPFYRHPLTTSESSEAERPINWWAVAPLVWAVPGTIAVLQQAAMYATRGLLGKEWVYAAAQFPRWMLWAPLTPAIFRAARVYPLHRLRLLGTVALHVAFALLCIIFVEGIHSAIMLMVERSMDVRPMPGRPPALVLAGTAILTRILSGFITYAAVIAVAWTMDYQRQLREETVRTAALAKDLAEAQVQSIKMQVQPHFLFNTLHAVNVLIERDPQGASRMISRLGDLLRHTLARAAVTEVPLRTELEVLMLYLDIERVRFYDRLTIEVDVDPATLSALVPDLVLQPLAENAIKHGIGRDTGAGTLLIRARREQQSLVIQVIDSGSGPVETIPSERIGLTTVRSRLQRLYGDEQSLTVEGATHGGCVATIRLPFHETPVNG